MYLFQRQHVKFYQSRNPIKNTFFFGSLSSSARSYQERDLNISSPGTELVSIWDTCNELSHQKSVICGLNKQESTPKVLIKTGGYISYCLKVN